MITYEMVPQGQIEEIRPLYEELFPNFQFPGSDVSCASVARDGEKIVGFWFLQLCAHGEPVGIAPEYEGQVSLHALRDTLHRAFANYPGLKYYVSSTDERLHDILLGNGFKFVGYLYEASIPGEETT